MYADDTTICYSSGNMEELNANISFELISLKGDQQRQNKLS